MHNVSCEYLLQIEPKNLRTKVPVDDELTKKMENLLAQATEGIHYRGFHLCCCGELSGSCDLLVSNYITNSLAVHYLRWHRGEVPESEIQKLRNID